MPYIKKELRPIFDLAVGYAFIGDVINAQDRILVGIKDKDDMIIDGCLNYVFTQLLRKTTLGFASALIRDTIHKVFLSPPKYAYLERTVGLLTCMIDEFERRGWRRDAIYPLKKLLNQVKEQRDLYENKKIDQNGDIDDHLDTIVDVEESWKFEASFHLTVEK